jgi:FAD/FMN-containing dehydrogenase
MTQTLQSPEVTDPVLKSFADDIGTAGTVAVAGGWTRWDLGGPLAEGTRVISAPTGIVSYKPEEMIVRVRAGTTDAELRAALRAEGQHSALPNRGGTVGGALAVGENCVQALGRGRIRTSLLQIRYVSAEGRLVTGGGTTVKNVSGFDLPRLMVGSLGTLGLFAELLLRTNPAPEATVLLKSDDADPMKIQETVLNPNMILWDGETTWVEVVGNRAAIVSETQRLAKIGTFEESVIRPPLPGNRWSLRPSELPGCGSVLNTGKFVASIGTGTVYASNPQPKRELPPGVAAIHERMKAQFDPAGRFNPGRSLRGR